MSELARRPGNRLARGLKELEEGSISAGKGRLLQEDMEKARSI